MARMRTLITLFLSFIGAVCLVAQEKQAAKSNARKEKACPCSADTVVLTNGDKFTGEIRKLDKGQLSIKLKYADDPLVMDWKMVASVTTEEPLKVTLDNGKEFSAKLEPAKELGQFLAVGTTTPVELKAVVKVEPAVPKPKGFDDRFYTDTSFTYDYNGASAFQNLVWNTNTAYYGDKWEPLLLLYQNFNRARALQSSTLSVGALSVNYYLTKHVYLFPWLAGEKVKLPDAGYGSSVQAGGGVGWAFSREKKYRLLVQGGIVADKDIISLNSPSQFPNAPATKLTSTFPATMLGFNWRYTLTTTLPTRLGSFITTHSTAAYETRTNS